MSLTPPTPPVPAESSDPAALMPAPALPVDPPRPPAPARKAPAPARKAPAPARKAPASARKARASARKTPVTESEAPASEPDTPASAPSDLASEPGTPASEPSDLASEPGTPAPEPDTPAPEPDPSEPGTGVGIAEQDSSVSESVGPASALVAVDGPARRAARQLSLFGVEANEPAVGDLAGLLAGPGEVVRMGGTARVSVAVDAAWRVHVLVAELARRGLTGSWIGRVAEQHGVRTSYTTRLAPLGANWLRGSVKRPPPGFFLNGPRLRLWTAAAGHPEPLGFVLRLGPADEGCWEPIGAALAAIGLPAVLLDPGAGGPAYRITGRRRLARLAELVGDRPPAAPAEQWPAGQP